MTSGPVASNLVFLSDLADCEKSTKVRFLGCVEEYVVKTGTLKLKHDYPHLTSHKIANVNIDHVLETVQRSTIDVGTWVNVIGYVESREEPDVSVQAVAVWDAGNVDVDAYEKALEKRKEAG